MIAMVVLLDDCINSARIVVAAKSSVKATFARSGYYGKDRLDGIYQSSN